MAKPMALNALTTLPTPQNSNFARAMYHWVAAGGLDNDTTVNTLITFCGNHGVNHLFLDIWQYLGGGNYTEAKATRMRAVLDVLHKSGIKVFALCGNVDWAANQAWVMNNIVRKLNNFNNKSVDASQRFDGILLDVEYWTDTNLDQAVHCAGLCDLIKAVRRNLGRGQQVGVFTGFFLKDNLPIGDPNRRQDITYNGKTAQDGEHLMDVADFVSVGTYRDTANFNSGNGQPGQIELFQPWYDYASISGKNLGLFAGTETINIAPSYITYSGQTKTVMEGEHTLISNAFQVTGDSVFMGQAVHSYDGWRVMAA